MTQDPFNEGAAAAAARRKRNIAIALALIGFCVLTFVVTIAKYL